MNRESPKGSYVLVMDLPAATRLRVGKLGEIDFQAGYYAYVGSAMNGFRARLPHHLRNTTKTHWHIDYLLQAASIRRILTFESEVRQECEIARFLDQGLASVPGFGCSDCRCRSHLFYAAQADWLEEIASTLYVNINKVIDRKKRRIGTSSNQSAEKPYSTPLNPLFLGD